MCRKQHGAAFATYATVGRKHVSLDDPSKLLTAYASSDEVKRWFCARCGSSLLWESTRVPKLMEVAVGSLDGEPGHAPDAHIFVSSKVSWHAIEDELPQYAEEAPAP